MKRMSKHFLTSLIVLVMILSSIGTQLVYAADASVTGTGNRYIFVDGPNHDGTEIEAIKNEDIYTYLAEIKLAAGNIYELELYNQNKCYSYDNLSKPTDPRDTAVLSKTGVSIGIEFKPCDGNASGSVIVYKKSMAVRKWGDAITPTNYAETRDMGANLTKNYQAIGDGYSSKPTVGGVYDEYFGPFYYGDFMDGRIKFKVTCPMKIRIYYFRPQIAFDRSKLTLSSTSSQVYDKTKASICTMFEYAERKVTPNLTSTNSWTWNSTIWDPSNPIATGAGTNREFIYDMNNTNVSNEEGDGGTEAMGMIYGTVYNIDLAAIPSDKVRNLHITPQKEVYVNGNLQTISHPGRIIYWTQEKGWQDTGTIERGVAYPIPVPTSRLIKLILPSGNFGYWTASVKN